MSDGQKVTLSLFPWLGVGKVMLRLETLDYRFGIFLNTTIAALKSVNEEITALRLMELQDRTVLDQLTASAGGVCAIIGTSCCTFVPDCDDNHAAIESAIANLTQLRDAMTQNYVSQGSLFSWFTTGSWWHILLKILTPFIAIAIVFCLLISCVIPCLRSMVTSMITRANATLLYRQHIYFTLPTAPPIEDRETQI